MGKMASEILDPDFDTYSIENTQEKPVLSLWADEYFNPTTAPPELYIYSFDYGLRGTFIGKGYWDAERNHMRYILEATEIKPR